MTTSKTTMPETVTVDGKHYNVADLSDKGRAQLVSLRFVDGHIELLNNRKALVETARSAYGRELAANLPEKKAAANRKKGVISIDGARYRLEDFSEAGRAQLYNIQFTEREQERLNNELAVAQTARIRYAAALAEQLKGAKAIKTQ